MNQFWTNYYYLSVIVVILDLFYTVFYSNRSTEAKKKIQELAELACTSSRIIFGLIFILASLFAWVLFPLFLYLNFKKLFHMKDK